MASLTSLPHGALEEIFSELNQHYTLALAPLHSKFHYVAKPKLYRNIYVYTPWKLNDKLEPNESGVTFRIPNNLNNCKSMKYSIISSDVFERYFMRMDPMQEINRLEMYGHNMTMIDCIFRHFKKIKLFELVAMFYPEPTYLARQPDHLEFMQQYLDSYGCSTHYICPIYIGRFSKPTLVDVKSINITEWYCYNQLDGLHSSTSLTELKIYHSSGECHMRFRFTMKLRSLHIFDCWGKLAFNFPLCDFFDTSCLCELSLKGDIKLKTVFSCTDMEQEFPRLEQLCIRFDGKKYAPSAVYILKEYKHAKLKSLVISSRKSLVSDARAVCSLIANFPRSSINWWNEILTCGTRRLLSHNMTVLSPNLPFGVVGYHFIESARDDLTNFEHTITDYSGREVRVKLRRLYTQTELYTICNIKDSHSKIRRER
ncbi:hypothetical protein I9W82_005217 [Candida metapsilosis]|uniref:F-box domain-containing protein n=1 Tax=Candida metapsilosis TaxID=273372 RepID=A0A8H7ZCT1_9ASCO|nr:hypothetical protein I9W82_005217 [Candida metapsilosis]